MTGHIANHFAQHKIVATDEFLEGTGAAKYVATTASFTSRVRR
jgi:hypothetical protein